MSSVEVDETLYLTGTTSIRVITASPGEVILQATNSFTDCSTVFGTASGTPVQGTLGIWLHSSQSANVSDLILDFGQDSNNYFTWTGQTYKQKVALTETTQIQDEGWTYYLFDADSPATFTGTTSAWASPTFAQIRYDVSSTATVNIDYFTVSKNEIIALNGIGERFTTDTNTTTTY